nr:MAG TPA: Ribosomal silencing factor during starvation [Caudoviricetes sp.]
MFLWRSPEACLRGSLRFCTTSEPIFVHLFTPNERKNV